MSLEVSETALKGISRSDFFGTRIGKWFSTVILFSLDYVAIVAALLTVFFLWDTVVRWFMPAAPLVLPEQLVYIVVPFIYLLLLIYSGMYHKRLPVDQCAEAIFKIVIFSTMVIAGILFFTKKEIPISHAFILFNGVFAFVYLVLLRYFAKRFLIRLGLWQKPVVLVGAGKTAEILAENFAQEPQLGYQIVGLIEDHGRERPLVNKYPNIGKFIHAEQAIQRSGVQDVFIAAPGLDRQTMLNLIYRIQPYVRNLTVVPDLFGIPLSNMEVETLYKDKTVMLKIQNNLAKLRNRLLKRLFDMALGSMIFVLILPVLFLLAILIRAESAGPVLYIAKRLGKGGKEFLCFKFRTMHPNADSMLAAYFAKYPDAKEEWDKYAKLKGYDPRVTKTGRWLRKYSLDELPQVLNVLIGNMSLVGPRPYLPREKERMGYMAPTILETVPGITGLWQVSGRNEIDFEGRLQMDSWYVRNWSLWQDIVLLIKTIGVVAGKKGAY
ncbi:hypothetical protein P22_0542 [Propionispora sp. 2/2-37]|uniref:undecaprenyl-phosphate galactose phosphotransferase WbaP n=1 Tax=Propionispora sp. 2/2-37 TaxID=1677858 RepID=UPI0006BB7216|nr:undecaprenyl-phosphate galactose phosphotransferase WbaP [Propionispora sp. 2/2-37]CUH94476.1 hypothetical protein P22_0542 [Propionispora sp. 2/2-37]